MRSNNQSQNQKRNRNRGQNNRRGGGGASNRNTFDSNGPNVRIRGSAAQIHEKYISLARDANASGDPVLAENLFQFAEHYYRLANPEETRQPRRFEETNQSSESNAPENTEDTTILSDSSSEKEASQGHRTGKASRQIRSDRRINQNSPALNPENADTESDSTIVETLDINTTLSSASHENTTALSIKAENDSNTALEQGDLLHSEANPAPKAATRKRVGRPKASVKRPLTKFAATDFPTNPADLAAATEETTE